MKIAIASMMHESNSFTEIRSVCEDFTTVFGEDVYRTKGWGESVVGGIYKTLQKEGAEIFPTFFARGIPSGMLTLETFLTFKNNIVKGLSEIPYLDGICLALHGSMAVDGEDDPEGALLEDIRKIWPDVPIVSSLDMHATLTDKMIRNCNGFYAYRKAPHTDAYDTGVRAAEILIQSLKEKKNLKTALVKIPLLVCGEQSETRVDPAKSLFESLIEIDKKDKVVASSYVMGFPWADSPFGGAGSLVCGCEEDLEFLYETAKDMAERFWSIRKEFQFSMEAKVPAEALKIANEFPEGPVFVSDGGDNPTAGATQNSLHMLFEMIKNNQKNAVFSTVADKFAFDQCLGKAKNEEFELIWVRDGEKIPQKFIFKDIIEVDGTKFAILKIQDITLIVSDKRCAPHNPELLESLGMDVMNYQTVVIKNGYLHPEYLKIAKRAILALSPGATALVLKDLPYVRTPRPIYPLDEDMEMDFHK
ncbi:MAG: M81 family metallopeptidase [Lachnospiraceae bacterium]|nr:M81 family metallopeptidase [Lachnospiraceae bacterium]